MLRVVSKPLGHGRVEAGGVEFWGHVVCIDYHVTIGQWTGNSPDDREAVVEVEGSKLTSIIQCHLSKSLVLCPLFPLLLPLRFECRCLGLKEERQVVMRGF